MHSVYRKQQIGHIMAAATKKSQFVMKLFIIFCPFTLHIIQGLEAASAGVAQHPAWMLLDAQDCGDSVADRIIGGTNAGLGQFPWIARLGYRSEGLTSGIEWLCGGALITPLHVVTAAHCTKSAGVVLEWVRLGEHNTLTDPDCQLWTCAPPVQDIAIERVLPHRNFSNFHQDLAMLVLKTPAVFNDYVAPICLPRPELPGPLLGEPLTVAGWGKMNMTTEERATVLQYVQVPLVPPEACDIFGHGFKTSAGEVCAGAVMNKDACGGDSGGPLMKVYDTPEGPKTYLVGVVSFGPTICGIKKPGVYTSVSYYLNWILDKLLVNK
ncbi:CLIP domain-containing serine protease HP8 isoform X1 [Plutella xylostella]|uniref:CLIP domain-containing serine protease HP8 isoform X1 n=2 Tax=Plutella xylostella TaxID=51655 RepID=UPI0020328157|nr:CLIP domain-containing serine protease HP8 isoform X1 [Plutella xylostella]